jgi:hypothetical protein
MESLFITFTNGTAAYASATAEQEAAISFSYKDDPNYLSVRFSGNAFSEDCFNFPGAFTINDGVIGFDLPKAKQIAESVVNAQGNEAAKKTLDGLSYDVYIAQSSLPAEQRIAKYQAAIDANNAIALDTEQREQAIYAATTIQEINAIVYPPAAE